jgi:hypothetical protein
VPFCGPIQIKTLGKQCEEVETQRELVAQLLCHSLHVDYKEVGPDLEMCQVDRSIILNDPLLLLDE